MIPPGRENAFLTSFISVPPYRTFWFLLKRMKNFFFERPIKLDPEIKTFSNRSENQADDRQSEDGESKEQIVY